MLCLTTLRDSQPGMHVQTRSDLRAFKQIVGPKRIPQIPLPNITTITAGHPYKTTIAKQCKMKQKVSNPRVRPHIRVEQVYTAVNSVVQARREWCQSLNMLFCITIYVSEYVRLILRRLSVIEIE